MKQVKKITTEEYGLWDAFVESSPQGTIFSTTRWLSLYSTPFKIWGYFNEDSLMGGFACFDTPQPCTPFQGILVADIKELKYANLISLQNEVAEALIDFCPNEFANHWDFPDVRPFLWHNWQVSVRYTYVCDLSDIEVLWQRLEKKTRYAITSHDRIQLLRNPSLEEFDNLYDLTFKRKELERPVSPQFILKILRDIPSELYMTSDYKSGVIMMRDDKRSYYILGASDGGGGSSFCLWKSIEAEAKVRKELDMVGANGKSIALFKRGFGGTLTPYYSIKRNT